MDSTWQKLIFVTLILAIAAPSSTAHRRRSRTPTHRSSDTAENLRDLCSETDRSDVCLNILKSDLHRFDGADDRGIVEGVIDLATAKSREIGDQLHQWSSDTNDEDSRPKFRLCSESYDEVSRNLDEVRRNLDSDDYRRVSDQIDDAEVELDKCRREFEGSSDPGHVGDRNNELGIFLDIVGAATDRLGHYYEEDRN